MGECLWGFESPLRHILQFNIMTKKGKTAVFLSGRGSNFQALYDFSLKNESLFSIDLVISDKKKAPGLDKARDYGIPAFHIKPRSFESRGCYEKHLLELLKEHNVELVCLAGYMRIVGAVLVEGFRNRIINIHPSLLPSFPGLDAQGQAFDYGVKVSGCTVHFVDEGMDTGPIILQKTVSVFEGDTRDSLAARILEQEHIAYSEAVQRFFNGELEVKGRKVL